MARNPLATQQAPVDLDDLTPRTAPSVPPAIPAHAGQRSAPTRSPDKHRVELLLDADLYDQLRREAFETRRTIAAIIRDAITASRP